MRTFIPLCCLLLALTACKKDGAEDLDADGYSAEEDCDDENPDIFPGAEEICDGVDNDCNDEVDEGVLLTFYEDADGDGYGAADQPVEACEASDSTADSDQDCDDDSADVYPGAPEDDCADPTDYNCDGSVQYGDADSDGWAACEDCNDADAAINPGSEELCDGLDNDCNLKTDGADARDAEPYYLDSDGDGFGDPAIKVYDCEMPDGYSFLDSDCDDINAQVYPGAEEICDGLDSDCDSATGELLYPSDVSDLQLAVDSGEPEICIEAGTHSVNLDLAGVDTLKLSGAGGSDAVFLDGGGSRVIDMGLHASNITLEGLTLQNANESGKDGLGVFGAECSNIRLQDIVIKDIVGDSNERAGLAIGFVLCTDVTLQDSAVHSVTATYNSTGVSGTYGLVGFRFSDNVVVDGLEIYDSSVEGFAEIFGGALSFDAHYTGLPTAVSVNNVSVHDYIETSTRIGYGTIMAFGTSSVDMSNVSVYNVTRESGSGTGLVYVFHSTGDVDLHNLQFLGNTSTFTDHQVAPQLVEAATSGDVHISNIVSAGNLSTSMGTTVSGSILLYNYRGVSYDVSNVTIYGDTSNNASEEGGGMLACSGEMRIRNSTISGNSSDAGLTLAGLGEPSSLDACVLEASYNNIYDNGVNFDTVSDFTGNDGNIGVDPVFADVSAPNPTYWDLRLAQTSDLIDAGDPGVLDADGSTSDIGAYGGPLGESWE